MVKPIDRLCAAVGVISLSKNIDAIKVKFNNIGAAAASAKRLKEFKMPDKSAVNEIRIR